MLREHAITYQENLTISDLEYLVKKANRLGKLNRDLVSIFEERDREGTHVYFNVLGSPHEYKEEYKTGRTLC